MGDDSSPAFGEKLLTRVLTILALTCFLVAGAAVTSILSRGGMQAADADLPTAVVAKSPVSNREAKRDRLTVLQLATASLEAPKSVTVNEPLRQAFAEVSAADVEAAKAVAALSQANPNPPAAAAAPAPAKPKAVAAKTPPQKSYALLSDVQIAGIKERLKLSSSQEYYWPAVENALRAVARRLQAQRLSNPNAGPSQLDPDLEEVQQLKSAAMPLLFQLREDQKDEVRKLARIIGLEKVAAAI
jgi:ABC-type transporter Mla MlaB component